MVNVDSVARFERTPCLFCRAASAMSGASSAMVLPVPVAACVRVTSAPSRGGASRASATMPASLRCSAHHAGNGPAALRMRSTSSATARTAAMRQASRRSVNALISMSVAGRRSACSSFTSRCHWSAIRTSFLSIGGVSAVSARSRHSPLN